MMKYLIILCLITSILLYICVFHLWIPQKYENQKLKTQIISLYEEIKNYNEKNKQYAKDVKNFRTQIKDNQEYSIWAKTPIPLDMLNLLQEQL